MNKRGLFLGAIVLLLTGLVLEGISFVGLKIYERRNPGAFVNNFIDAHFNNVNQQYYEDYLQKAYHPMLGWDNKPGSGQALHNVAGESWSYSIDRDGARAGNPYADGKPEILTYGDSFTQGDEVNDDKTWQVYLSRMLKQYVTNYGVGGYGSVQALLKFELHLASGRRASKAILGIHEFNIARVMNGFRPFAIARSGAKLGFKPAFIPDGKSIRLYRNPFKPDMTLNELRDTAYQVAEYDFWANQKLLLKPPYTWVLMKLVQRRFAGTVVTDYRQIWSSSDGIRVMDKIVSRFVDLADRHGIQPVLLLIPDAAIFKRKEKPVYAEFLEDVSRKHSGLLIVDIAQEKFNSEKFNILPYQGHASAYGNEVIARAVFQAIKSP